MFDKKNVRVEEMYKVKIINIFPKSNYETSFVGLFLFQLKSFHGSVNNIYTVQSKVCFTDEWPFNPWVYKLTCLNYI